MAEEVRVPYGLSLDYCSICLDITRYDDLVQMISTGGYDA